jgi:hypothetical protein
VTTPDRAVSGPGNETLGTILLEEAKADLDHELDQFVRRLGGPEFAQAVIGCI